MTYNEFEKQVVDTFNRMHFVESCDDAFMIEGADADVQIILAESFIGMFHIEYHRTYTVHRDDLRVMFEADVDNIMGQALQSYNDIMNRYNVVGNSDSVFTLHII